MSLRVLLVRPRASGGLAAHVDQEHAALEGAGVGVRASAAVIGERPSPRADAAALRVLRRETAALRATGPIAVHAHGLRAGALAALAVRSLGPASGAAPVRLVVTLHNRTVGGTAVRAVGAVLLRILTSRADVVLAVSPDLAEQAARAGASEVLHAVVPAPAGPSGSSDPVDPAGPADPADAGRPLDVLVIARLAPQKGLPDLLDAVAVLERDLVSRGRVRVGIAGDGPLRQALAERIAAERLPVELLGRREDVPALLSRADLVVSAARWEGQPVALQEALRAGRAIIATDAGGTRWVTQEAATLVPVGDAPALASAILEHLDPAVRRHREQASRQRARSLPGARDMTDQLLDVLAPRDPRW
ncbi:glycosyltransferase [Brachybacterium rhamnosum]|uniref:Glycosyltransferase n=1 Tax=Brachybacterium rhamnosum TaxID=173361 RepID=A0ABW4PXN0_9MICO